MSMLPPGGITTRPTFPYNLDPYTNGAPFTYRDGMTFLRRVEALVAYLNKDLVPWIDEGYMKYVTEFNEALTDIREYMEKQELIVDGKVTEMIELVANTTTALNALLEHANTEMDAKLAAAGVARDAAVAAAELSERWAGASKANQDQNVRELLQDPASLTWIQLKTLVNKSFVGLSNVNNTADVDKPVSTVQKTYIDKTVKDSAFSTAVAAGLKNRALVTFGHSYMAGSGIASPNKWAEQFAALVGLSYPEENMRAVGGAAAEEVGVRSAAADSSRRFRIGDSTAISMTEGLINTARRTGANEAARRGALNAMRTVALVSTAKAFTPANSGRFNYVGAFNDTQLANVIMSDVAKTIPSGAADNDRYVEFVMPAPTVYVMTISQAEGDPGCVVRITNNTGGGTINSFGNVNTAAADAPNRVNVPIKIDARIGDTIRVYKTGSGAMTFDGIVVPSDNPRPVLFMKEPYLADYSLSTAYPMGSDSVFNYFNAVLDTVKTEFPSAVVANPNTSGKWDKTTMLQADGVHPNLAGSAALAEIMYDAVMAQVPANIIATALRGAL